MKERNYLISVLSFSALPKVITSGLTFVCFPLMVRALGTGNYGAIVYIGAIVATLESFVDFGVSSAAGKAIAKAREMKESLVHFVVIRWARLQFIVAAIGFVPLILATYLIAGKESSVAIDVMFVLVSSSWITIALNFVRASLTSLLAFKKLAILDLCESLTRSGSWLIVAFFFPTTIGLAIAQLITAILSGILAIVLLYTLVSIEKERTTAAVKSEDAELKLRFMLYESFNFLWLRLVTRIFQAVPIVLLGKIGGTLLVGTIGAFAKMSEIINFPFSVIGNALAVRAQEVVTKGYTSVKLLWDAASRFVALAVAIMIVVFFSADLITDFLLPDNKNAAAIIAILSITILSNATSSIIAPMSDYVGALRSRNILISIFVLVECGLIWIGSYLGGSKGATLGYMSALLLMNMGYLKIALKSFFGDRRFKLSREVIYFSVTLVFSFILTFLLREYFLQSFRLTNFVDTLSTISFFSIMTLSILLLYRKARLAFLSKSFLDFQGDGNDIASNSN